MSSREQETEIVAPVPAGARSLVASLNGTTIVAELPEKGRLVIGRGAEADIVLDDPSVSRKHAVLEIGHGVRVEDLGSANGTIVGGRKLSGGSAPMSPGMVLQLGSIMATLIGGAEESVPAPPTDAIVVDPMMLEAHEHTRVAATSALSILLLGETGVGKELFARRVHELSTRASGPLVRVNCAAIVESLLEAELFGYERGAFTGANAAKPGLLEAASGGTLFLDEVGELPLPTQAKLLRVLENGEVMRVGALKPRAVDVRFVSATHRDLRALVAEGRFREDLFFRLDGVSIRIPPLRERLSEIGPLAESFIAVAARAAGRAAPSLTEEAIDRLKSHPWSGNVRELRNVIQRSVLFAKGPALAPKDLQFDALGAAPQPPPPPPAPRAAVPEDPSPRSAERAERRQRVVDALEKTVWNQTRAAELLGISRRTLQAWLIELNIPRPRAR